MSTFLVAMRSPTRAEKARGAEVVFVREDTDGGQAVILACSCYESWEQWGAQTSVLTDNLDDVEAWRRRPRSERAAIARG